MKQYVRGFSEKRMSTQFSKCQSGLAAMEVLNTRESSKPILFYSLRIYVRDFTSVLFLSQMIEIFVGNTYKYTLSTVYVDSFLELYISINILAYSI